MRTWMKLGSAILLIVILIGIGWFGFKVESVTVTGSSIYSDEELRDKLMDEPPCGNSIYLYLKNRFFGFESIPFIQEVQLEWTGFHDVKIRVYEKSIVACFSCMGEFVYFDKDGIVLESSKTKLEDVPMIEGIPYTQFSINKKLDIEKEYLLKRILDISQLIKHNKLVVDKIVFNSRYEVTLLCGDITVLLGDKELYDQQIVALSSVIAKANKKQLKGNIDLTSYTEGGKIYLTQEK